MAGTLYRDSSRDLWSESKKINSKGNACPSNIDGQAGDANIASVFAGNCRTLYNSVTFDSDQMSRLNFELTTRIKSSCCSLSCYCSHCFSVPDVRVAIGFLKTEKNDKILSTDHLINAGLDFVVHFSFLCTAMIRHGYSPGSLMNSTVLPIPKNLRKSLNDSNNYRGIALNSPFIKLFVVILELIGRP